MRKSKSEVLIERFLDYQSVVKGLSPMTLSNHRRWVSMWLLFLAARRKSPATATKDDAMIFWRTNREVYAPSTLNHQRISIRLFYRWLNKVEGETAECPFDDFSTLKPVPVARKTWLSSDDIQRVIRMPLPATPKHLRDRALFAVLASTAARIKEILRLDVAQLRPDAGKVMFQYTKTGTPREGILLEEVWGTIEAYLHAGRPKLVRKHTGNALFIGTRMGNRLDYKMAWHAMDRLADMAGLPHFSPHDIRRSVASIMNDAHVPLDVIAAMLGHSKLSSTEEYLRWHTSARLAEARAAHPLHGASVTPDALSL